MKISMNRVKRLQILFIVSVLADIAMIYLILVSLHNHEASTAIASFGLACNVICQLALLLVYFTTKMNGKEV